MVKTHLGETQQGDLGVRAPRAVLDQRRLHGLVAGGDRAVVVVKGGRVVDRRDLGPGDGGHDAVGDAADAAGPGRLVAAAGHDEVDAGGAGGRRVLRRGRGGEEAGNGGGGGGGSSLCPHRDAVRLGDTL